MAMSDFTRLLGLIGSATSPDQLRQELADAISQLEWWPDGTAGVRGTTWDGSGGPPCALAKSHIGPYILGVGHFFRATSSGLEVLPDHAAGAVDVYPTDAGAARAVQFTYSRARQAPGWGDAPQSFEELLYSALAIARGRGAGVPAAAQALRCDIIRYLRWSGIDADPGMDADTAAWTLWAHGLASRACR